MKNRRFPPVHVEVIVHHRNARVAIWLDTVGRNLWTKSITSPPIGRYQMRGKHAAYSEGRSIRAAVRKVWLHGSERMQSIRYQGPRTVASCGRPLQWFRRLSAPDTYSVNRRPQEAFGSSKVTTF